MSTDLRQEMENLRRITFGRRYDRIRRHLNRKGYEEQRSQFRELEDHFFHMVPYILSNQHESGWWYFGQELQNVITAHAIRHLHKIGISLKARWNPDDPTRKEGNLFRATRQLIGSYNPKGTSSRWGTDFWDDCYIVRALLEVESELDDKEIQAWDPTLRNKLQSQSSKSLQWLREQFNDEGFKHQRVTDAEWFGPGFYAAAIELFAHPTARKRLSRTPDPIDDLVAAVEACLKSGSTSWHNRFAWHAGQILVTWSEKRKSFKVLQNLDPIMKALFAQLLEHQSDNGAWDNNGAEKNLEYKVYYTVRGLAACYTCLDESDILECKQIHLAHQFLLKEFRRAGDGRLVNTKASINAIGAFQKLFDFNIRDLLPNAFMTGIARMNRLGLLDDILNPAGNDAATLRNIRKTARKKLEASGEDALELLGVNSQLYDALKGRDDFLKEFTGDRSEDILDRERSEILEDLRRCLSSTLTETRSKFSHRLIMRLWDIDGFLNFRPLIEHLSDLEQDRAFYKYYRDHLNHELLLFLFGAYIYFNCQTFRDRINDEILELYEDKVTNKYLNQVRDNLTGEFLFRWKLISTFHDIGYLFEVDPFEDKSNKQIRSKKELIEKSFGIVDKFRENFLYDYLLQTLEVESRPGLKPEDARSAHEEEVKSLAEKIGRVLNPYPTTIKTEEDLLNLSTAGQYSKSFKLISQYVRPGHIGPDLIRNYFYLCGSTEVLETKDGKVKKQRDPFYDHGIMSALVLLKTSDVQRHYLKELSDKDFEGSLLYTNSRVREALLRPSTREHLDVTQFFIRFSHVAGAIALHNIWPTLYTKEQCENFDKSDKREGESIAEAFHPEPPDDSGRYLISFDENPLSYLTALADTLQDWDRHSFRRLSFTDDADPLTSSELTIGFKEDSRIHVTPLTEGAKKKYAKLTEPSSMNHLYRWKDYLKID